MKTKGNFIFKGATKKEGGTFTNDKGQKIEYSPKYLIKFDEIITNDKGQREVFERSIDLKEIPENNELITKILSLDLYSKVDFDFDVQISKVKNTAILSLLDVAKASK